MLEQYADTAYKSKQDAKFRDEIATDERETMYCRYQSKQAIYPRGKVYGHCYDSSQSSDYKYNLSGKAQHYRNILGSDPHVLSLSSLGRKVTDVLLLSWGVAHLVNLLFLFTIPLFLFLFGDTEEATSALFLFLSVWGGSKLFNLTVWKLVRKKITHTRVNFERNTGLVWSSDKGSKGQKVKLPFEQFNAHYKVQNNPQSGFPYRGFTLLHFKKDVSYAWTGANLISSAFVHWELLQNFMDFTQPLADIPQFEYYREFDKTTAEFDKANGRPKYFWYRVDKSFLKQMNHADDELLKEFNDEEQLNNLLTGKPIKKLTPPDIFKFPWKYADNIKAESEIKFGKTLWQKFTSFLMVDL